jgi:phage repressor protein C with HTH and peptisase S24 domain
MSLHDRIREARKAKGLTQAELGELIGVAKTTVAGYEKNREPTAAQLGEIADVLDVDVTFLLQDEIKKRRDSTATVEEMENLIKKYRALDEHGKGTVDIVLDREHIRCTAQKAPVKQEKVIRLPKGKQNRGKITEVDVYDEPAAAGLGNPVDEAPPHHLEQYPTEMVPSKTDFGVLISGDSMEPKIPNGSTVFVQAAPALDSDEIGVFVLDGKTYCKQLKIDHDAQRTVLHSINPAFEDMEIPAWAEFRTLGRVLDWYAPHKLDPEQ